MSVYLRLRYLYNQVQSHLKPLLVNTDFIFVAVDVVAVFVLLILFLKGSKSVDRCFDDNHALIFTFIPLSVTTCCLHILEDDMTLMV